MNDIDSKIKSEQRIKRITIQWAIIGFILVSLNFFFWFSLPALRAGGVCLDIVSGKVPAEAEERFFNRIFEDTLNQNYKWIRSVSHPEYSDEIIHDLQQLEANISNKFEVIYGDDLAGGYNRILEFDNGLLIKVNYDGRWPECPDDDVTDAEINKHLELTGIGVQDNVDWLER